MTDETLERGVGDATLVDVVRRHAAERPDQTACLFLADGEHEEQVLTYAALEGQARRIAAAVARRAGSASPVLLLFDPGLDFIPALLGCFLARAIAVPVYPPDPRDLGAGVARIGRVADDAGARIALTTRAVRERIGDVERAGGPRLGLEYCALEDLTEGPGQDWRPSVVCGNDVAFLQYTSGSTGTPRGVMVTHGNLMAHGRGVAAVLRLTTESICVSWLPVYHDMGLIGAVLIPLQVGFRSIQMAPLAFLERPQRWLQAISRYRGTLSPAPNFAYDLVVRKTAPAERRALDLRTWTAAMNGAEPVRAETCERFATAFAESGFRREAFVPCYGLAEATLMASGGPAGTRPVSAAVHAAALGRHRVVACRRESPAARVLIASGHPLPALDLAIVQPETCMPCAGDEVGEIWIGGDTVAAGYWRRPGETGEVFGARLADGRGAYLRTGDLGFMRDGQLFVTGRCKDMLVIRGRNYYPQDLEASTTGAHPALRPGGAAAFAHDDGHAERAVVVAEIDAADAATWAAATAAIRAAIARQHAIHVAAVVLIPPRALPKTSSGKVRRRESRARLEAGTLPVLSGWAPADGAQPRPGVDTAAVEDWLLDAVAELRGLARNQVTRDDDLVALGIDSAEAAHFAGELETRLGRRVPIRLLMEQRTIGGLATALGRGLA